MRNIVIRKQSILLFFLLTCIFYACNNDCDNPDDRDYSRVIIPDQTSDTGKGIAQGNYFNKNWRMSVEAGADLVDMYTDSSGITYAISNYGIIYSRTATQPWKREDIDCGYAKFTAISGYGSDVYITGEQAVLFHKHGTANWIREETIKKELPFTAIYVFKNELWLASGQTGSVWHRNSNGTWKEELSTHGNNIFALYGNNDELWALCKGAVYHKNPGTDWQQELDIDKKTEFRTLYQYGHHAWAMGSNAGIYYNNGGKKWTKENTINITDAITCSYGNAYDIYAAGLNGLILHRLPSGLWQKEENVFQDFTATSMYGQDQHIWIAGHDGFIIHKSGNGAWTKETTPVRRVKINAFGHHGDTLFAVGDRATLMTRTADRSWIKENTLMPDTPFTGIFKYEKEILVTGNNGTVYHRLKNGYWQQENSHAGNTVFADAYESRNNIYLAGNDGRIAWRRKTDTAWQTEKITSADLSKIYGYDNEIWVTGNHSALLHKKETDNHWQEINIGTSEVEFIDVYGWQGQIWLLGVKDSRGIIFYKNRNNQWTKENIPVSLDHYHALYGRHDTVWAAGASGYWGLKYKSGNNYAGMIICREGNNPWKKQVNYLPGVHFNAINGAGDDVYAVGNAGNIYHKYGNNDWEKEETLHDNDDLKQIIFYKGLLALSEDGFLYREHEEKNFISINRTNKLVNIVTQDNYLFGIGNDAIFKISPEEEKYPVIDKVSYTLTPFINPTSINLRFTLQRPPKLQSSDMYRLEIYARPYSEEYTNHKWEEVKGDSAKVTANKEANIFLFSQNIELTNSLRVIPGLQNSNKVSFRIDVITEDGRARESFILKDSDGSPFFTLSNNFWNQNKAWIIPSCILVCYYLFWLFLWFFFPLTFLRIYHSDKLQQLLLLKYPFHFLVGVVNVLFPLKTLANTRHVMNAWVMDFAATAADKYEKSETTALRPYYIPLPVRMHRPVTGPLIEKPDESILEQLFSSNRTIVQIIGPGGAGKTTLAVTMGRWIIHVTKNRKRKQIPKLPILLETDSKDLLTDITHILRSWQNDYSIHEDFVKMLLKNQRLVIIIDALSEKPASVQDYFKTLHGTTPANALIITARNPVDLQVKEGVCLYPAPLNSNNLLHFITTYLSMYDSHILKGSREQLAFAEKVLGIIESSNNNTPVTPILVKLIIEIALKTTDNKERDFQTIISRMPDSIPDVYYRYLVHVNPSNPSTPDYLPQQAMLQIAEILGRLSLGNNFIPRDFEEAIARKTIAQEYSHLSCDPIRRFIDNGILTRKESFARSYLRFNIDPLAEYLAASKLYDENNTSPQQLSSFADKVRVLGYEAQEFKTAFRQVSEYKKKHG